MTTAETFQQTILSLYAQHVKQPVISQVHAHDFWATYGAPGKKEEAWRTTNLQPFYHWSDSWVVDGQRKTTGLSAESLKKIAALLDSNDLNVVFINGVLSEQLSRSGQGVTWEVVAHDAEKETDLRTDRPFVTIGRMLAPQRVVISTKANTRVVPVLRIVHVMDATDVEGLWYAKHEIHVAAGSVLSVEENYISLQGSVYGMNAWTDCVVGAAAVLNYTRIQNQNKASFHFGFTRFQVQADAQVVSYVQTTGASLSRHTLDVQDVGARAQVKVWGAYVLNGQQVADQETRIDHVVPHTSSEQIYKGIVADKATATFDGKITVRRGAAGTRAKQLNQNILLSPTALVNTKPQLDIDHDDVSCTHGATVGQMNEEEFFYLQSRGLSPKKAQHLLLQGFVADVVNGVTSESVQKRCWQALNLEENINKEFGSI